MALKFLNKKGWHTGSLRNIETVWKAEQKHESEQKKLEELRKQIHDEREKSEFRLMQEQAGLVPRQERLEFLYDSGLQVGKVSQTDEYLLGKPVEEPQKTESDVSKAAATPGALFVEEKPASANDSWRKLHSDPLLLIRQQEQAAIARIKNNPVKMAQIKKEAEMKKKLKEEKKRKRKEDKRERKEKKHKRKHRESNTDEPSDSEPPLTKPGMSSRFSDDDSDDSDRGRNSYEYSLRKDRQHDHSTFREDVDSRVVKKHADAKGISSRLEQGSSSYRRHKYDNTGERRFYNDGDQMHRSSTPDRQDSRNGRSKYDTEEPYSRDRRGGHDLDDSRYEPYSKGDGTLVYDRLEDAHESRKRNDSGRRGRYDNIDGARGGSQDNGDRRRAYDRREEPRELRARDECHKRQMYGSSEVTKDSRFHDRGAKEERHSEDKCDDGVHRERYINSEDLSNSRLEGDGDRSKEYGLIIGDSPVGDYSQISTRVPFGDDPECKEHNVKDENGDKGGERDGGKFNEVPMLGSQSKVTNKGRPPRPPPLSEADRAARLAEMQSNADLHEEQRWQRLKHAAEKDAAEVKRAENDKSNEHFMADNRRSMFGTEKVSSTSSVEKSVKRRAHFIERSGGDSDKNAFRR